MFSQPRFLFQFPLPTMSPLYSVQLQYRIVVDTDSATQAHRIVRRKMAQDPAQFITRVETGSGDDGKRKPLWRMFLTG